MNTRTGKIARLPASIRTQLNERLDDGHEGPELLDWLNALTEVQEVLEQKFKGVPVSKQNLSEWRQGGFQDWLLLRELCGEAEDLAEAADELAGPRPGVTVIDNVAAILATRLGSLLARWNGEVDEKVEARAKFLNGLCRSVVRLQRSTHQSNRDRLAEAMGEEEAENRRKAARRRQMLVPLSMLNSKPGASEGKKAIEEYITRVMCDDYDGAWETLQNLDQKAKGPVKPASARPRRGKAKSRRVRPSQSQSNSLKPNQSDLPADVQADLAEAAKGGNPYTNEG
jgi:hypothetical protein